MACLSSGGAWSSVFVSARGGISVHNPLEGLGIVSRSPEGTEELASKTSFLSLGAGTVS